MPIKRRPFSGKILFEDRVGDFTFILKTKGLFEKKSRFNDNNEFFLFYKKQLLLRERAGMENFGFKNYDYFVEDDFLYMYYYSDDGADITTYIPDLFEFGQILQYDMKNGDLISKKNYMSNNYKLLQDFKKMKEQSKDKKVTPTR